MTGTKTPTETNLPLLGSPPPLPRRISSESQHNAHSRVLLALGSAAPIRHPTVRPESLAHPLARRIRTRRGRGEKEGRGKRAGSRVRVASSGPMRASEAMINGSRNSRPSSDFRSLALALARLARLLLLPFQPLASSTLLALARFVVSTLLVLSSLAIDSFFSSHSNTRLLSMSRSGASSGASSSSQNRSNTRIISSRFNQENSCIAVATTAGFRVLNCDPFSKCYEFSQSRGWQSTRLQ